MNAVLEKQIYKVQEGKRWAEIEFVKGRFAKCVYQVSSKVSYNLDDWKFLGELAQEIQRLALSYETGREKDG